MPEVREGQEPREACGNAAARNWKDTTTEVESDSKILHLRGMSALLQGGQGADSDAWMKSEIIRPPSRRLF